jgi:lipopolysaccharide/colanic/teichoic acid biosynthesis glycosyltransferase
VITIYKIRTMYQDCERQSGAVWSVVGDPRITPLGRFLRASHIDELPQFVNVLRGDMSLIGPRPERQEIVAQLQRVLPDYRQRLTVRPGLTGLAQVLQGPDADLASVERKLKYDLYYLNRPSPGLDLRILLATVLHVLDIPPSEIARIFGFPYWRIHSEAPTTNALDRIGVVTNV